MELSENLQIRSDGSVAHYCCAKCATDLGPIGGNYKDECLSEAQSVAQAVPLAGDPHRFIDAEPEFRRFFCPGCGALIEAEVATSSDATLRDITLEPDGFAVRG